MKNIYYSLFVFMTFFMLCNISTVLAQSNVQKELNNSEVPQEEVDRQHEQKVTEKLREQKEKEKLREQKIKELILGVPKASGKTLPILIEAIEQTKGVEYIMFCDEHRLMLIKYNIDIFPTRENVLRAFKGIDINMPIQIKNGTFEGVMEMCSEIK